MTEDQISISVAGACLLFIGYIAGRLNGYNKGVEDGFADGAIFGEAKTENEARHDWEMGQRKLQGRYSTARGLLVRAMAIPEIRMDRRALVYAWVTDVMRTQDMGRLPSDPTADVVRTSEIKTEGDMQ